MKLVFQGPYCFSNRESSVFEQRLQLVPCIYLWTIRQRNSSDHLIHYIGETNQLGLRHREHLINILGLNYGIFDPEKAKGGVADLIWPGLWRDRSSEGPINTLANYQRLNETVMEYLLVIEIFFAELDVEKEMRRHIEGCIGWNLRSKRRLPHLKDSC